MPGRGHARRSGRVAAGTREEVAMSFTGKMRSMCQSVTEAVALAGSLAWLLGDHVRRRLTGRPSWTEAARRSALRDRRARHRQTVRQPGRSPGRRGQDQADRPGRRGQRQQEERRQAVNLAGRPIQRSGAAPAAPTAGAGCARRAAAGHLRSGPGSTCPGTAVDHYRFRGAPHFHVEPRLVRATSVRASCHSLLGVLV